MSNVVLRTQQEGEDFIRGLCFRATGGGGGPEAALKLLFNQLEAGRQIELVEAKSLPDEAWTVMTCGFGGRAEEGGTAQELAALGAVDADTQYESQIEVE